jgi:FG-GAP repeat
MRMLASFLAILLISTSALCAPPQLAELTASDGNYIDQFGTAVAVSGSTVVVGAPLATVGSKLQQGAVYVFVKPANGWGNMTQVAKLTLSGQYSAGIHFGSSVAISGDTIVVGPDFIFVKPVGGWKDMTETAVLYGFARGLVAIDRDTIALSMSTPTGPLAIGVYTKPKSGWVSGLFPNAFLTNSDSQPSDLFASSVALSGGTVVVGAPGFNNQTGASYVFVKPVNGWTNMTETAKLTASNGGIDSFFGQAVAINAGTIVVGAPVDIKNNPPPTAYVFVQPLGGWANMTETAQLQGVYGGGPLFASSVAVSGNRIVVGDPGGDLAHSFQGASYIFTKPKTGWHTTSGGVVLRALDHTGHIDLFGWSVAMNGGRIVIGTDKFGLQIPGAAYVF